MSADTHSRRAPLNAQEQITRFHEFFEKFYYAKLLEHVRKGETFLVVDFRKLSAFDPELAELLLDEPEEILKAAEEAVKEFDLSKQLNHFYVRVKSYPSSAKIMIRDVRTPHLGKMVWTEGTVRQKSDVRPQVVSSRFECPSCGTVITILQIERKFREPSACSCGRKGKFKELSKELIDAQGIVLEEASDDLEGGEQPKRINVLLKNDLVSPLNEKRTSPGSKIRVGGWISEIPTTLKDGGKSTKFDLVFEANHTEAVEEDYTDIKISNIEEEQIKELAQDPHVYEKLVDNIAPSIYGHEKTKEGLLLQFVGGVRKEHPDGTVTRGDMHVLLVGDPGCGKCVVGKTKIMCENGEIKSIESLYENALNRKVFSLDECGTIFSSHPVRFFRRKAPEEILRVITNSGNELLITKEHPLFTTEGGLIFAKMAEEFRRGEYIATPSKVNANGEYQCVPRCVEPSHSNNRVRYKIKNIFDGDFARLLGYLVGDGYVRYRKTTGIISFTNKDVELLNDFERLIERSFGLQVSKRYVRNGIWEYYVSSIELVRILEVIDPAIIKKSGEMSLCTYVTRSPDDVVKEFVKSLFDCEAHVRKTTRVIEFSSKSKDLVYDLKYTLLRFGVLSQIFSSMKCATNTRYRIKRKYYRLQISGESVRTFYDKVGFTSKIKQNRIESVVESGKEYNTNINVVPNVSRLLKVLRKKYNLSQYDFPVKKSTYQHYEKGDRRPSYSKLREIASAYKKIKNYDPLVQIIDKISNADIFWDRIKSIDLIRSSDEFVFDMEIENVHNFFADGVVVHNSQLLKRSIKVAPKARYVSGKGVSGAGLTAAVIKDEFLGGWSLEAGALVLSNHGFVMIDELDKMGKEDRAAMHEALEQQTVSISKANIQATLRAETTVLAAANPKLGRFNQMEPLAPQIDLPPTLINRFDLIFPVKDIPDKTRDEKMAQHILGLHQDPALSTPKIPTDLLRKFIAYARKTKPKISNDALDEIKTYYVSMRNKGVTQDSGLRAIPITARQLEALVRLAEASAKVRLSELVTREDAKRAIAMLEYCLMQVALDKETGLIDIDQISTGISTTQRSKIIVLKELISELENQIGKTIPIEDVVDAARHQGIAREQVEDVIEKLKRQGDIFEPKRGFIQRIT